MGGCLACIDPAVIRRACACRSERRLAKRCISIWLTDGFVGSVCLEGKVPDPSTFSKNR
jgi:hypothetical protein